MFQIRSNVSVVMYLKVCRTIATYAQLVLQQLLTELTYIIHVFRRGVSFLEENVRSMLMLNNADLPCGQKIAWVENQGETTVGNVDYPVLASLLISECLRDKGVFLMFGFAFLFAILPHAS